MPIKILPLLVLTILLSSCCLPVQDHQINDLQSLPQDPLVYLSKEQSQRPLLAQDRQQRLADAFLTDYFAPWNSSTRHAQATEVFWGIEKFSHQTLYGPHLRQRSHKWWQQLVANCQVQTYPSSHTRAITVRPTSMRVMPSHQPAFYDYRKPGEGFPFDMFQNTSVPANTPLLVTHLSEDRAWFLAQTASVFGWIRTTDIAFVDDDFVQTFQNNDLVVCLQDIVSIRDRQGLSRCIASIGSLFPLCTQDKDVFHVYTAGQKLDGSAALIPSTLPKQCATLFPLSLSAKEIASIIRAMIGQPYGWGGLYQNRDCSATMQDLFKVFGLWLPRNSSQQALSGQVMSLSFKTSREKQALITNKAIPYFTFLTLPGHIMLYLGTYEDQIVVFHNLWGIRTWDLLHGQGRHIVGQAVITTLSPGKDLINFAPHGDLLLRINGITILPPGNHRME